jgi:uncharacterized protein (DUF1015 family)
MLYRDPKRTLDAALGTAKTLAVFQTSDGIEHRLSKITAKDALASIVNHMASSSLLIADGHHRYETALRYAGEVDAASKSENTPRAEHRYFMTFLANGDDPNLLVFPTHRHVHALAEFAFDDLVRRAGDTFLVTPLPRGTSADSLLAALSGSERPAVIAAAADGGAVRFEVRPDVDLARHPTLGKIAAPLRTTDVSVLHAGLLEHVLGITPEAQAKKANLWYPQDAGAALASLRAGEGQVLFLMRATPVADVRAVAEAGDVMPQKSTFFFPKVLTGLAVHTLDPSRRVAEA